MSHERSMKSGRLPKRKTTTRTSRRKMMRSSSARQHLLTIRQLFRYSIISELPTDASSKLWLAGCRWLTQAYSVEFSLAWKACKEQQMYLSLYWMNCIPLNLTHACNNNLHDCKRTACIAKIVIFNTNFTSLSTFQSLPRRCGAREDHTYDAPAIHVCPFLFRLACLRLHDL